MSLFEYWSLVYFMLNVTHHYSKMIIPTLKDYYVIFVEHTF